MFIGPTLSQISEAVNLGLDECLSQLFYVPLFTQPLAFLPEETITPFADSWVYNPYPSDPILAQYHENAEETL
jgi:hypothetical protein